MKSTKALLSILVLSSITFDGFTQQAKKVLIKSQETLQAEHLVHTIQPSEMSSTLSVSFHNSSEEDTFSDLNVSLSSVGGEIQHGQPPGEDSQKTKVMRILKDHTNRDPFALAEGASLLSDGIALMEGFEANAYNSWYPPDNAMAISGQGYIVSLTNSSISYYDEEGNSFLNTQSLGQFYDFLGLGYFFFDPRVLFDTDNNRFVMVCLYSNSPSTNKIILSVSMSQNPMDGWYTTTIDAEDIQEGAWFDFPNIGVSSEDIFISGNMFSSNSEFLQSVVVQIDKDALYEGQEAAWELFTNISDVFGSDAFTLKPMSYGLDGAYGPGIYLVSTRPGEGDNYFLYSINNQVESNQIMTVYAIETEAYSSPVEAAQNGSNKKLITGGVRIRDGYFADNHIHFVHTINYQSGFAGVRYTKLNLLNYQSESIDYGLVGFDYAYPSIAPFKLDSGDKSVLITCLRSGSSLYPEIRAFEVAEDMTAYNSILVKSGESPISVSTNLYQRWGDYTSSCRRNISGNPSVWVFGSYGKNMKYGNYIGEISVSSQGAAPLADFLATNTLGTGPLTVTFSDESANGENRYWWFPGGSPSYSTEANPVVVYADTGRYDVQLSVSNEFGEDTKLSQEIIDVGVLPDVDIADLNAVVGLGENIVLNGISTSVIDYWEWIIEGADAPLQWGQNPIVSFSQPGDFDVELKVTNAYGESSIIKEGHITVEPLSNTSALSDLHKNLFIFPNPTVDYFSMDISTAKGEVLVIDLYDEAGQIVENLYEGMVKKGNSRLSFNSSALSGGVYYLVVKDFKGKSLTNEKIIIHRN